MQKHLNIMVSQTIDALIFAAVQTRFTVYCHTCGQVIILFMQETKVCIKEI